MENKMQENKIKEMRDMIWVRIRDSERDNYAKKPNGLHDKEMVDKIQKIIESEVNKCL